ncbi:hypothetical protein BD309DRAFT_978011 [Dichomitus squalens]|uniref:F-box domain-containing protein n=1 Tax=Dichomitus squalens TaxID=114155 RepID=A0A4Q9PQD0_9APHY|nr:hypothetical protein BD311DRAFT_741846 [Dichomitus squalens]TBU47866.1 hypothetical protein BD309DRAFT_978011 [Dichomitus squalens]TBU56465.1 hypothetical protein BD310DRAFT_907748 [Dichomitus squalens]
MSKRQFIPIEIFELVIDFIEDEKALQSTSLVCKAWLPRSRFNLFRVVELNFPGQLDSLLHLLESAPDIAPIIKEISISENSILALFRPAMSIAGRFPLSLSSYPLVQPRRLTVHNQLWLPTRYSPDYLLELSRFSSITSLDLFDVSFTTVADFSIILRALGRLESLHANHVDCQRQLDSDTSASIGCELPFLTFLRVSSDYPTSAVDWLIAHNKFPSLRDIEISYEIALDDQNQGLGALWASTGSTLENLKLGIFKRAAGHPISRGVMEKQLNLSSCTALRTLRFDCRGVREVSSDWTWLIWLITQLPAGAKGYPLRSIVLAFQHSSHALASLHRFTAELDRTLSEPSWAGTLAEVVFELDYRLPADEDEDELALLEAFAGLRSRNLLRIA